MSDTDPRLKAHAERIWPGASTNQSPLSVTLGPPPPDHIVVEQYWVLPNPATVRFLVPLGSRATSVAAFRTYNATRAPTSRAVRGMLAGAYASGLARHAFPHTLTVSIDATFPRARWGDVLILQRLAADLGRPNIRAFTAVRAVNPNAKSTLELLDGCGRHVGYAKIGTTAATRRLVRSEASALVALKSRLESITTPDLIDAGNWGDAAYAVTSPLPEDLRRWRAGAVGTAPGISTIARTGDTSRSTLSGSAYAARLRADLEDVSLTDEVPRVLRQWLARLEGQDIPIDFGRMHGDWISDNLGASRGHLVVWDWEHSSPNAPVGLDLLHWYFHSELVRRGLPTAVRKLDETAPLLNLVGVPSLAYKFVTSLYLLDVFVRRMKLASGGGGWNKRWFPGLIEVARSRDLD